MTSLSWKHKPMRELIRLAWPIAVSTLSYSTMTLVDTLFVGRIGPDALAAVSVGGVLCFTLLCFGMGALRALKVGVSQAVGAEEPERVPRLLAGGLVIAGALGLANVVAGLLLAPHIELVTASAASGAQAADYVNARVLGAPLASLAIALREARYGMGDSTTPMRAALVANVANIGLDYLLIVALGWGVAGAGWASAAAGVVEFVVLAVALVRAGEHRSLLAVGWRRTRAAVPKVWRLGVPMGMQMMLEVGMFAVLTALFAAMSAVDVAAHQIALQVAHFSFLPAWAVGEAASVLAGQAVGARDTPMVGTVSRLTLKVCMAYTGLCGLVMLVWREPLTRVFTTDEALVATTMNLFIVGAVFQVFDGANIVARSMLRGVGDVRFTAWVSVGLAWLVTPPIAFALGYGLGWGVVGGWIGFCAEIILGAGVLWWRLSSGRWRHAAARERERLLDTEEAPISVPPPSRPATAPT